jgi:hypothetical protein
VPRPPARKSGGFPVFVFLLVVFLVAALGVGGLLVWRTWSVRTGRGDPLPALSSLP